MDEVLLRNLKDTLKKELNFSLENYTEIKAGGNNKLFCLSSGSSKLLLKVYNAHDDRQRLKREFQALSFLYKERFECIPGAFLKNDSLNYAIYSYENGKSKNAKDVTRNDLDQMVDFIVTLQGIKPVDVTEEFLPGVMACFSFQDYLNNIQIRLEKFKAHSQNNGLPDMVKQLLQSDYVKVISDLVSDVMKKYTEKEIEEQIPLDERRLSPVDFGPHNTIFGDDGSLVFVDFEYFGWDDPNRLVGDFLNHDQIKGISEEDKKYFLKKYLRYSTLSEYILNRLDTITKLIAIEWVTTYLSSLTKEKIEIRRFANSEFNEVEYVKIQIDKYKSKLKTLQES